MKNNDEIIQNLCIELIRTKVELKIVIDIDNKKPCDSYSALKNLKITLSGYKYLTEESRAELLLEFENYTKWTS